MNIFTLNDDFGGHVSLFCEAADVIGEDGEQFVRLEDHVASHAFDEAKERELFEAVHPVPEGVKWDAEFNRYLVNLYPGECDSEYGSLWDGWLACAKSRANQ